MKILIFGTSAMVASYSFIAPLRIARACARHGDEVIMLGWLDNRVSSDVLKEGRTEHKWGINYSLKLDDMLPELEKQIEKFKPDIVYSMGTGSIWGVYQTCKKHKIPLGMLVGDPYYANYPSSDLLDIYNLMDFLTFNEGQAHNYVKTVRPNIADKCYLLNHAIDPELSPTLEEVKNIQKKYICSVIGGDDRIRRRELLLYYYQWTNSFPGHKFAIGGSISKIKYEHSELDPKITDGTHWNHTEFTEEEAIKFTNKEFNLDFIPNDLTYPLGLSHKAVHKLYSESFYSFTPYGRYIVDGRVSKYNTKTFGTKIFEQCYDDKTEVLTDHGWKYFKDLDKTEKIATLNLENNHLEYQLPNKYITYDWKGDIYRVASSFLDLAVTPQHKMLVKYIRGGKKTKEWHLEYAVNAYKTNCQYKCDSEWKGEEISDIYLPVEQICRQKNNDGKFNTQTITKQKQELKISMKDWVEFLGYYISEGSLSDNDGGYKVVLTQSQNIHPEIFEKIIKTIKRMGFSPSNNGKQIWFWSKPIFTYIKDNCYEGTYKRKKTVHCAKNKKIPNNLLFLNKENLNILYNSLMDGDGCRTKNRKGSGYYYTTSEQLSNQVQELVMKCGFVSTIKKEVRHQENWNDIYRVNIRVGKINPYVLPKKHIDFWEYYDGKVYCVTVPNHVIYVRRNGKPVWCGNCGSGSAVIANDIADLDMIIKDGETGFILKKPEDAYKAFKLAVDEPETVKQMGINAYNFAHKFHSWDNRYLEVLSPIFKQLGIK